MKRKTLHKLPIKKRKTKKRRVIGLQPTPAPNQVTRHFLRIEALFRYVHACHIVNGSFSVKINARRDPNGAILRYLGKHINGEIGPYIEAQIGKDLKLLCAMEKIEKHKEWVGGGRGGGVSYYVKDQLF